MNRVDQSQGLKKARTDNRRQTDNRQQTDRVSDMKKAFCTSLDESNDCCLEGGPPLPLVIPEVNLPPDLVDKLADVLGAMTWHLTQKVVSSFLLGIWDIPLLSR